jgi:DNA-binding NtrC family response regulator
VRELRNVIEQAALFSPSEVVQASDIQLDLGRIERHGPHRRLGDAMCAAPPSEPTEPTEPTEPAEPTEPTEPTARGSADPRAVEAEISSDEPADAILPDPPSAASTASAQSPVMSTPSTQSPVPVDEEPHPFVLHLPLGTRLADAERKLIVMTLEALHGNKLRAARILGISRRGLYSKLEAYDEPVAAADTKSGA